jgi:hypothetical protein
MLPILHGSLLVEGKRDHPEEGKQHEEENGIGNDGDWEGKQR